MPDGFFGNITFYKGYKIVDHELFLIINKNRTFFLKIYVFELCNDGSKRINW